MFAYKASQSIVLILPNSLSTGPYLGYFKVGRLPDSLRWVTGENATLFESWDTLAGEPVEGSDAVASVLYVDASLPLWKGVLPASKASYICENTASGGC